MVKDFVPFLPCTASNLKIKAQKKDGAMRGRALNWRLILVYPVPWNWRSVFIVPDSRGWRRLLQRKLSASVSPGLGNPRRQRWSSHLRWIVSGSHSGALILTFVVWRFTIYASQIRVCLDREWWTLYLSIVWREVQYRSLTDYSRSYNLHLPAFDANELPYVPTRTKNVWDPCTSGRLLTRTHGSLTSKESRFFLKYALYQCIQFSLSPRPHAPSPLYLNTHLTI